jgi:energy-coupling factor transporter ATP-binding protein EcfA2
VDREHKWDVRRRVSVVFQDPDDQLVMNRVVDDVAFGPENLGLRRDEISERVESSLAMLGLEDIGGRLIEDLSPGQKQRVAIAGALAMRPMFLILDEPTSLLPVPVARRLISTVRDLSRREGMGVLHVTHSMYEREVGLEVPLAASLAHRLRARGILLEGDILNVEDLRAALSAAADRSPSG